MKVINTPGMSEKRQHFLQHKEKHISSKEAYTDGSKSTGRKVGYTAVFTDTTRRGVLPEEASIHTAEMTAMKEIKEYIYNIFRLLELNAGHREQQRNSPNTVSDI